MKRIGVGLLVAMILPCMAYATMFTASVTPAGPLNKNVGDNQTLTSSYGGTPTLPVTYQWYKNDVGGGAGTVGTLIGDATTDALVLTNLQLGDQKDYSVCITESGGSPRVATSNAVTINVSEPPFTVTISAGGTYDVYGSWTCTATPHNGSSPYSYQWYKNVVDGPAGTAGSLIPDATTDALTFTDNLVPGDEGAYSVVATDDLAASATSTISNLLIADLATTISGTVNEAVGGEATFTVLTVTGGGAPYSYQWYKNTIGGGAGTAGTLIADATSDVYFIPTLAAADQKVYSVVVTDNESRVATSAGSDLTVLAIETHPASHSVDEGDSTDFTVAEVAGSGSGAISYQWQKSGSNILNATTDTLEFEAAAEGDAGVYDCVLTDAALATLTSNTALLTVVPTPVSVTISDGATRDVGGSWTCTATAIDGVEPYSYQWYKNVVDGPAGTVGTLIPDATTDALEFVANIVPDDEGAYSVVVVDAIAGTATSEIANLLITDLAIGIDGPNYKAVGDSNTCSITAILGGGSPYSYQWYRDEIGQPYSTASQLIPGATCDSYTIDSLVADDQKSYYVVVTDSVDREAVSDASILTVLAVGLQPVSHSANSMSNTSFTTLALADSGMGEVTYQWRKSSSNISGATDRVLGLSSIRLTDAGIYDCVLTDGADASVTTNTATLTVVPTPIPIPAAVMSAQGVNLITASAPLVDDQPYIVTGANTSTSFFIMNAEATPVTLAFDWVSSARVQKRITYHPYTMSVGSHEALVLATFPKEVIDHDGHIHFHSIGATSGSTGIVIINMQ